MAKRNSKKTKEPAATAEAGTDAGSDLENRLYLELESGRVVIHLRPDLAPNHVARIKELARQKFYDGVVFHRVIDGFMAQTGDPTGTGTGGSGQKLKAEFNSGRHVRGACSMARAQDPNSADSQFFICFEAAPHLDGQYTMWGEVIVGMEHVDKIKKGAPGSGMVTDPDRIKSLSVAADVKGAKA
jgi:peptidylprolyl isomerase